MELRSSLRGQERGHRRDVVRSAGARDHQRRATEAVMVAVTVAWFGEADPPDHDLLRAEAARLAAVIGTELDLEVTVG